MLLPLPTSWLTPLADEVAKPYFTKLIETLRESYQSEDIYPRAEDIFNAFSHCAYEDLNVVILGQDPYHGPNQAHGLSFSVQSGTPIPPSLRNIYKEIVADIGSLTHGSGNLEAWAKQGVLLLNSSLTVRAGVAGSHRGLGWERFTDAVIEKVSTDKEHVVFMLWGRHAAEKGQHIDRAKHLVLLAAHPSPLSAYQGFLGCKHFSQCNTYLTTHGKPAIVW